MRLFIEACFVPHTTPAQTIWKDISDEDYFIFTSDFGVVRLRKRFTYPKTFAYSSGAKLIFGYGHQANGIAILRQSLKQVTESAFYDEFLLGIADCENQTVVLQRDAFSTVPLFVAYSDKRLVMANVFERAVTLLEGRVALDHQTLGSLLIGEPLHSATLARNVIVLHDRQRLEWHRKAPVITYPAHGRTFTQQLESRSNEFVSRLEATLQKYWVTYATDTIAGTELSCGLDTSMINGFFATQQYAFKPVTLVYPGMSGDSLRARLSIFAERFGIVPHQIRLNTSRDYPLAHLQANQAWQPFFHAQDLYAIPLERAARHLATQGATVVFRGIGGDELMDNLPHLSNQALLSPIERASIRRKPPAFCTEQFALYCKTAQQTAVLPTPALSASVAAGAASGNNVYLSYNIWPVLPLADPELYTYCQGLPIRYRTNRNIVRAYLQAKQFPEAIYNPLFNEDFEDFFNNAVINLHTPFDHFIKNSVLAKHNLIDAQKALAMWNARQDVFELYCLLVAEINLQTLGFNDIST